MTDLIQDLIELSYTAEDTIISDSVIITARVEAVGSTSNAVDLANEVLYTFSAFVPGEWTITNIDQWSDTGINRVRATGTIKVKGDEAKNLEDRRVAVGKPGIEVKSFDVSGWFDNTLIAEAEEKLKRALAKYAAEQATAYSQIMGDTFRVHRMSFHEPSLVRTSSLQSVVSFGAIGPTGPTGPCGPMGAGGRAGLIGHDATGGGGASGSLQSSDNTKIDRSQKMSMSVKYTLARIANPTV